MREYGIDLYIDIVCPWCLIGEHRLQQVIDKHFAGKELSIQVHPVILMPDCPADGIEFSELIKARGMDPKQVQEKPQQEARAVGLVLDLQRQPRLLPTLNAHTLIRMMRDSPKQFELAKSISEAYFLECLAINDSAVLADLAKRLGIDPAMSKAFVESAAERSATIRAAAESAARGVRGVPHYIFGDSISLSGHQSEGTLVSAIRQAYKDT